MRLLLFLAYLSAAQTSTSTLTETSTSASEEEETFDPAEFDEPLTGIESAQFIEAIEVIGNAKTERTVIMRRLLVEVGDLVNDDRIEESRLRLLNTGYFKSVELSLRRGSERGRVMLVIEVAERNTILIDDLYLGFSSRTPFYGGFGIGESNFLGNGVSTNASFVVGKGRRAVDLHFFVPDLSDTPLQLSGSAIFLQGAEVLDEREPTSVDLKYGRIGGTLGLGIGVGPAQRVSLDYRLEAVNADRLPNLDPALLRRAPQIQFGDSVMSSLILTYERDTRDDPFVPTQGGRIVLGVEAGTKLIGSSYEFSKYFAEAQQAFLIGDSHSLIIRAFGGLVQGQTPFFNQFFISDYAYFAIGRDSLPRAVQLNFSESNDYDDLIFSTGADYSIPIQEGGDLLYRTYVFGGIDISVTASLDEVQEDETGRGTGGQVPLSFDAGVKLDTWIGNFTVSLSYMLDLVF
jgi:outer membrane protein assembly factor BamA